MKFLHLADLHIGKKVNGFSMIDDQKFVLEQVFDLVVEEKIDSILISGDVFDRSIPNISSLDVFGEFLSKISELKVKIFIISGNHDSQERLSYLSSFLVKSNIFISPNFEGFIKKISLNKDFDIFLMPYLHPSLIKKYFPDDKISSYNEAFEVLLTNTKIDKNKINIILAHQFVAKSYDEIIKSEGEEINVGGLDMINPSLFSDFDYCALGHLHCPQSALGDKVRYGGSILKYSFSEINQKKVFTIVDIKSKNDIKISFKEIKFLHEMKEYKGFIDEFLDEKFYLKINKNDYIKFTLEDESVLDAKKKLNSIYPNIMLLEFDNSLTRNLNSALGCDVNLNFAKNKNIFEHFCDFYELQTGLKLDKTKEKIVLDVVQNLKGGF